MYAVKEKKRYWVASNRCLGMSCFMPGGYQHRGTTGFGSRNTGSDTLECMTNAYHGCPENKDDEYDELREMERKRDGWKMEY